MPDRPSEKDGFPLTVRSDSETLSGFIRDTNLRVQAGVGTLSIDQTEVQQLEVHRGRRAVLEVRHWTVESEFERNVTLTGLHEDDGKEKTDEG